MDEPTPAEAWLTERGIPHRVFRHAGIVTSLEQAAQERGQRPEQVVRSLVFRIAANEFMMVLAAGTGQVSWKRLREYVGQNRLTMATPEEVILATGYRIGTVSPFAVAQPMRTVIDGGVLLEQEVSVGSGQAGVGIIIAVADMLRAMPDAERGDLVDAP
ncbi:MAG TPA: YbaK/EbsC family protein [Anaerolineales bacterium]|nr:YbaK/EbsC family protein [Anaerolineales bacterium]